MVNDFVSLSPKKQDEEECFYMESSEKQLVSESSDEDTTSSSLMPIPDTLDVMRKELKTTINNFGTTDYVPSPKPNDFTLTGLDLDRKHPTEREVSIARKITSANLLLDDLINTTNILPKNVKDKNPLVFAAKTVRQRSSPPGSETSDPSTTSSSSSDNRCPTIPVTTFVYPQPVCECSRYPNDKLEPVTEEPDSKPEITSDPKRIERKCFLLEKMRLMRMRCKKKAKRKPEDESQQTAPSYAAPSYPPPSYPPPNPLHCYTTEGIPVQWPQQYQRGMGFYMPDLRDGNTCTCPDDAPPVCTCEPVKPNPCECRTRKNTKDAKVGSDEAPEYPKTTNVNNDSSDGVPEVPDRPMGSPLLAAPTLVKPIGKERIDVYYFDHGNSSYYKTTDSHRARFTEYLLERTDEYASKFWAEIFGTVTIAIAFVVSFILQLYRCVFTAIIRALTVGLIQIFSDYFFKPLLTVLFNGLIQPCLILGLLMIFCYSTVTGYNIATSTKDFCIPVCEICEFCAKDLAIIFGSCRLVEVKQRECSSHSCHCRHNV